MRNQRKPSLWMQAVTAIVTLFTMAIVLTQSAQAQGTAPAEGWKAGEFGWQVSGASVADPGCPGVYALDIQTVVTRFTKFSDPEVKGDAEDVRAGRDATYWCEPTAPAAAAPAAPTSAPARPTAVPTRAVAAPTVAAVETESGGSRAAGEAITVIATTHLTETQVALVQGANWDNFIAGISPIVVSEKEGVLNVWTLSGIEPVDSNGNAISGTFIGLEPWRAGCGKILPQTDDPDCNVGKAFLFSSWEAMATWLLENEWWEGSIWFRADLQVTGAEPNITCVAALNAKGKALNWVPGENFCPAGIPDPTWVVDGVFEYPPVADRIRELEMEVAELEALVADFCEDHADLNLDACVDIDAHYGAERDSDSGQAD